MPNRGTRLRGRHAYRTATFRSHALTQCPPWAIRRRLDGQLYTYMVLSPPTPKVQAITMTIKANLDALCRRIEAMAPGSSAGVTLCDAECAYIEHAIFPTLAPSFAEAVTGVPTQPVSFGSCVRAIGTGEPVTSSNIESDERFDAQWKQACLDHGLRSIQSRPIFKLGKAVGTFVLAYREPRPESEWNVALMKFGADGCEAALSASS